MRPKLPALVASAALFVAALPLAATATQEPVALTRVIVELDPAGAAPLDVATHTLTRFGGRPGLLFQHAVQGFVAELPQAAIEALSRNPSVVRITPDRIVVEITAQEMPTGYDRVEADLVPRDGVPKDTTGCPAGEVCTDVDIAVLDTGTNVHPDLNVVARADCSNIIVPGFGSCVDGQGFDGHGHGTHVSGTAAAFDNGIGTVGIAPGARIHSVKVLGDNGTGYLSAIIAGVDWVTARAGTIEVANMSLAGQFADSTFDTAIANSVAAGITYVVAAGNSAQDTSTFSPANHPDVITVSAVADADGAAGGLSGFRCREDLTDDTLTWFSNFGVDVDIAAPGGCIYSTWNDGGYHTISGTSMASPHVAGAAALYIALHGPVTDAAGVAAVKAALITDGHPQGTTYGFTGDPDLYPEPLLFVNGPAFGGTVVAEEEPVDATPADPPTQLTATADGYPIRLEWTAATDPESGLLGYRVYRNGIQVGSAAFDAGSYLDRDTTPGASYAYEVSAVNLQFGESALAGPVEATTSTDDPTNAGWWALDDDEGTTASDSSAWRRPARRVNGPTWTPAGSIGGALTFDGADDRVDLDPAVLHGAGDVTFAVWIKTTKTGEQALISGANAGNENEFQLQLVNHTRLRFYTGSAANLGVEWDIASIADGQWHHLAVRRINSLQQVWAYRDGVSVGGWGLGVPMEPLQIEGLVIGQDQDSVLGGFQPAQAVAGGLDEVRLYTRALAVSEIEVLAQRDLTPPTAPASLDAVAVGSSIDLGWAPADDPDSGIGAYQVWRDDGAGGTKTLLATLPDTQTTFRDTGVRAGFTYAYETVAINGSEVTGPPSPEATATAGAADSDLAGWWALDDGSGTTATDWSPGSGDGTLLGNPAWTPGRHGGALTFDGTDDRVDLPASTLDGADDVTVTLWFKTTKTGVQALVSGANGVNQAEYALVMLSNPGLQFRFYTGETNETHLVWALPPVTDGEWHHLAAVRDGTGDRARIILDGVALGWQTAVIAPLDVEPGGVLLGQEQDTVGGGLDPTQAFVGTLDDVRIHHRLLTLDEVRDLAGLGTPTLDQTPPAAPTGLTATAGDSQVSLDWDDHPEPGVTYTVWRSTTSGSGYTAIASGLTTSTHLDTTAVNGTTSHYVVTAFDTNGNQSDQSAEASATPQGSTVVERTASSEITESGSVGSGDLTATFADDGVAQELVEQHSGGKPSQRVSSLDHRWTFEVGNPTEATLVIDAFWSVDPDGDGFLFEYSDDGVEFFELEGVSAADDGPQYFFLFGVSGTVVIRATDTDRTIGEATLDSVFVDLLVLQTVSGPPGTPMVTVTATDPLAAEAGSDAGTFTLTRSETSGALTVDVQLGGDALNGSDYTLVDSTVTFADGQSTATLIIIPIDDADPETTESVVLTVVDGADYDVVSPSSDTVTITDNDQQRVADHAVSESTTSGLVSGSLSDTIESDDVNEVITEESYAGGKRTRLDHTWTFDVTGGSTVTFHLEAFRTAGSDDFAFEYSVDGSTWIPMLTVTSDLNTIQTYLLPTGTSGTVHVRVVDTDRSRSDPQPSSVHIDFMVIYSE